MSMPIKQASRKITSKNISEIAKLKNTRSIKTARMKYKKFADATGDNRKVIRRFPPTTTARYTANFQEASILSFRNMLYPITKAMASTTAQMQIIMYKSSDKTWEISL
jgi:hypothetical protein